MTAARSPDGAREALARAGLDLTATASTAPYNAAIDAAWRLPDFGRPDARVLVIGNSRALWPRFVAAVAGEPARLEAEHPLDDYVAEAVERAMATVEGRWVARYASAGPPEGVAIQRLAELAGLAWIGPARLCVHPVFGPWIGLRAAVVLDADAAAPSPVAAGPCGACDAACQPAFEAARGGHWRRWLAARDACPVGRTHRYDDLQIRYHYTKDRAALRAAVEAWRRG